jgi:hypothetical protein
MQWRVDLHPVTGEWRIIDCEGEIVCVSLHGEQHLAKIAAAPDMFDALLQAREWLRGWASAEPQLAIVEAALAKAEGLGQRADATQNPPLSDLSSLRKGAEVAVKPLEWVEEQRRGTFVKYIARTPFGGYEVNGEFTAMTASGPVVCLPDWKGPLDSSGRRAVSVEAAKSAAQSDFEARIRSALVSGSREDGA